MLHIIVSCGLQLCGNNPYVMTRAAQVIDDVADVDFIDVNLGCPIDLVYKQVSTNLMIMSLWF